jgi:post-segregation antitoxin (ccd killing protein)
MTSVRKVRKTVTLDADLIEDFGDDGNLSAAINGALRREVEMRRRSVALGEWLDELAAERGNVDEGEVTAAVELLR